MENTAQPVARDSADPSAPDTAEQALAEVQAEVASDAARAPAHYLRDSIVPEGGE